jgi:hypothetical protein
MIWGLGAVLLAGCGSAEDTAVPASSEIDTAVPQQQSTTAPTTPTEACEETYATVTGLVWDYIGVSPEPGARIVAEHSDGTVLTIRTDQDGVYTVRLEEGLWAFQAYDSASECFMFEPVELEVVACKEVDFDIYLEECIG